MISIACSVSIEELMVAGIPARNSFLMISAALTPVAAESSLIVIGSAILTGPVGFWTAAGRRPPPPPPPRPRNLSCRCDRKKPCECLRAWSLSSMSWARQGWNGWSPPMPARPDRPSFLRGLRVFPPGPPRRLPGPPRPWGPSASIGPAPPPRRGPVELIIPSFGGADRGRGALTGSGSSTRITFGPESETFFGASSLGPTGVT